jgi:hypothetical protein
MDSGNKTKSQGWLAELESQDVLKASRRLEMIGQEAAKVNRDLRAIDSTNPL